jgi:hypothetical protein
VTYTAKSWNDGPSGGTPITAAELARIEAGIVDVSDRSEMIIVDMLNSWWAVPCAVYDAIRNIVYVTGVTRGSSVKVGTFDLGLKRVRENVLGSLPFAPDDHYTPALMIEPVNGVESKTPLAAWSTHDQDNKFHIRKGISWDVPSLTAAATSETTFVPTNATTVSYSSILRKPTTDTLVLMGRMTVSGVAGTYFMRSVDRGANWTGPYRLHGKDYSTYKLSADGLTAYFGVTGHPISSVNPEPIQYVFKVNLSTGVISKITSATTIGNLWTDTPAGTTAIIAAASMDLVVNSDATYTHRLLDVAPDGTAILTAKFARADLTNGVLTVYRWNGSSWVAETIGNTGAPFGYTASFYIGGGVFDNDASTAYLVQESSGIFKLDKWTASAGVWTKGANIRTAPAGSKIGRPRVPMGAEGLGIITWGEYVRYAAGTFSDYYGHQRIVDLR